MTFQTIFYASLWVIFILVILFGVGFLIGSAEDETKTLDTYV